MATPCLYRRPQRPLTIEAAIVSALALGAKAAGGPVSDRHVVQFAVGFFPWASRLEIARTLARMVKVGRVIRTTVVGRSLPVFVLP